MDGLHVGGIFSWNLTPTCCCISSVPIPDALPAPNLAVRRDAQLAGPDPQPSSPAAAAREPEQAQQQQQQQQQHSGEGSQLHPELPLAPEDEPAAEAGVVVELEEGAIRFVKVGCCAACMLVAQRAEIGCLRLAWFC